jgi:hypothetical protein
MSLHHRGCRLLPPFISKSLQVTLATSPRICCCRRQCCIQRQIPLYAQDQTQQAVITLYYDWGQTQMFNAAIALASESPGCLQRSSDLWTVGSLAVQPSQERSKIRPPSRHFVARTSTLVPVDACPHHCPICTAQFQFCDRQKTAAEVQAGLSSRSSLRRLFPPKSPLLLCLLPRQGVPASLE